jgi:KDO2-lipid IV(A) lauroyltransferase
VTTGSAGNAGSAGADTPLTRFLAPRYWGLWLGFGVLRLVELLPFRAQWWLARGLGRLLAVVLADRRRVAATNLALCFPDASPPQRARWLREHFHSLGMAIFDFGLGYWAPDRRIRRLVHIHGGEHLLAARAAGQGVILFTGHLPATEMCGRVLQTEFGRMAGFYRPIKNPLVDEIVRRTRGRITDLLIPKDNLRQLIRTLRQGYAVYFAPDQSHRRSNSALLPFFGEPAMTNTALSQVARLSGAAVVPLFISRRADGRGYDIEIQPALADFPGESPEADTLRVNALLEAHVRRYPAQYYWIHRRFKGRPPPLPDPYAADAPSR